MNRLLNSKSVKAKYVVQVLQANRQFLRSVAFEAVTELEQLANIDGPNQLEYIKDICELCKLVCNTAHRDQVEEDGRDVDGQ